MTLMREQNSTSALQKAALFFSKRDSETCAVAISVPSLRIVATNLPRPSYEEALNSIQQKVERRGYVLILGQDGYHSEGMTTAKVLIEGQATAEAIHQFCDGKNVQFSDRLDFRGMTIFQRRVLLAVKSIPRGRARSYSGIADEAGFPKAYRAVGNVMATNPFPPIVPCHRVIRSSREVGNFGSGIQLKKKLLLLEGVEFEGDRIRPEFFLG